MLASANSAAHFRHSAVHNAKQDVAGWASLQSTNVWVHRTFFAVRHTPSSISLQDAHASFQEGSLRRSLAISKLQSSE